MLYDAIVIGGGPAGASTAYHLSKSGLRVLIVEKEKLPRFKLCAGCLSARTLRLLPEGYKGLILNTISSGKLGYRGLQEYEVEANREVAYIVDRSEFDHFLVQKALEVGAELLIGEFMGFEKEGNQYKVYTSRGNFYTDYLIGADGFHSKTAKLLGYKKRKFFRSLELFTEGSLRDKVLIEIGWVSRGYLWVFPHGDGVSLGIATTGRENLLEILRNYALSKNINFKHPKGWHIPFPEGKKDIQIGKERVLLAGDSANMTDPLLGEGIYYALWAGKILAKAIIQNPSEPTKAYELMLKPLAEELIYAGKIARLAYRFQSVAFKMGKDYALRNFYRVLTGDKTYKDIYWKGWLEFLKHLTRERIACILRRHEGSCGRVNTEF